MLIFYRGLFQGKVRSGCLQSVAATPRRRKGTWERRKVRDKELHNLLRRLFLESKMDGTCSTLPKAAKHWNFPKTRLGVIHSCEDNIKINFRTMLSETV
jgi:hypothetical protein